MTIDVRLVSGDDPSGVAEALRLYQIDQDARDPGDPPMPERQFRGELIDQPPDGRRFAWLATAAGRAVGVAWAGTESDPEDELQVCSVEILVPPSERRKGVAEALVARLVVDVEEAGQTSLAAFPCHDLDHEAAVALCRRYGMTPRSEERCSRAQVGNVDEDLLDRWLAEAPTAAPGYRLERWEGPVPEAWAEAWGEAKVGMDDAPLDDFEYRRHDLDVDGQRRRDEAKAAAGFRLHRSLVVAPDGSAAGLSELMLHEDRPQIAYQDDTAVLRAHRGRRLGRWLKAANYRALRAAHPEVEVIETYNAESNPWMLDINVAMGFRPHHNYDLYQASLQEIRARLAS